MSYKRRDLITKSNSKKKRPFIVFNSNNTMSNSKTNQMKKNNRPSIPIFILKTFMLQYFL